MTKNISITGRLRLIVVYHECFMRFYGSNIGLYMNYIT